MAKRNTLTKECFMRFVSIHDDNLNGCWEWMGSKNDQGYGNFKLINKAYKAHRISYMLFIGDIPENMCVCHSCDNPSCVNPAHLWLGTNQDNVDDKMRKGRQSHSRGEERYNHKLDKQKVIQIRQLYKQGYTLKELSKMFGVSISTVFFVKSEKVWGWVE